MNNIVYKRNEEVKKCRRCSIVLVPENGSVSYWYGDGEGSKKLVNIISNDSNSWNKKNDYCNYCLKEIYGHSRKKLAVSPLEC